MEELEELVIERISRIDNHDTILVADGIIPEVGDLTDIEYNNYRIAIHNVEFTNENNDEVIVKFSISANPYSLEQIDSLSDQARDELNGYDLKRICTIEDTDEHDEEETSLEVSAEICYVYEVKTKL